MPARLIVGSGSGPLDSGWETATFQEDGLAKWLVKGTFDLHQSRQGFAIHKRRIIPGDFGPTCSLPQPWPDGQMQLSHPDKPATAFNLSRGSENEFAFSRHASNSQGGDWVFHGNLSDPSFTAQVAEVSLGMSSAQSSSTTEVIAQTYVDYFTRWRKFFVVAPTRYAVQLNKTPPAD